MNQMSVATFDTLAAVRNLEKAGMGTSQAEAVTETIRIAVFQGVATKEDIGEVRTELKTDIAEVRAELKADIAEVRTELKADIAEVRTELQTEIAEVRTELQTEIAEVRTEIAGLRGEMKEDHARLRADFEKFRADMTWRMVVIMGGLLALFAALDLFFLN